MVQFLSHKINLVHLYHCLPMNDVVRANICRTGSPVARRQVFKKLNAWSGSRAHRGYEQMRSKDLVKMFLLGSEVLALACFAQSKQVTIKLETRLRVRNSNGSVIDTEK